VLLHRSHPQQHSSTQHLQQWPHQHRHHLQQQPAAEASSNISRIQRRQQPVALSLTLPCATSSAAGRRQRCSRPAPLSLKQQRGGVSTWALPLLCCSSGAQAWLWCHTLKPSSW
jgi:hypothetical protein